MIIEFLKRLEDPKRRLLGPNIRLLKSMGLLLPENIFLKAVSIFVHEFAALFVFTQYINIYVIRSDFNKVLENVSISLFSVICVLKVTSMLCTQKKWNQLLEHVTEADEYEREHQDNIRRDIIDRYTKHCRRITYFYCGLCLANFTTRATPLLKIFNPVYREGYHNGTEPFPHIHSAWLPFDKNHSPGCWITLVLHFYISAYGLSCTAFYDTSVIAVMTFFGGKLDLLRERAKLILGTPGNIISGEEAGKRTRQLYHQHVMLIEKLRLFNSLLSPILFYYVVVISVNLCAILYKLTTSANTAQKVLLTVQLLCTIVQLYIYCSHGNDVLLKSEQLMFGPYESEWWNASVNQKKNVFMLAGQFRMKQIFTAGPFTSLTLPTFVTLMKGAYSYYAVLSK